MILSTSYVADVKVTFDGTAQPTVKKLPVDFSKNINPESPGFVEIVDTPLIKAGLDVVKFSVPVPPFLKPIHQPPREFCSEHAEECLRSDPKISHLTAHWSSDFQHHQQHSQ